MTDINEELIKRLEALKFKNHKIGLNSLIQEIDPKIKTSPWTIIKSVLATIITLLVLTVSILMLPILVVIISAIVIYVTYKISFSVKEFKNDD
jgi:hypothetical protein|tara:strand:- start:174 stop:452 length:279 start_codon:yes stop_codon:yes gene_type:complete